MKKLLQITTLACTFAANVQAHVGDLMYVRGDITWSQFNDVSIGDQYTKVGRYNDPMTIKGGKYSNKYNFGGVFGLGSIVNDKLRVEGVYNRVYANRFKYSDNATATSSKIKADINAFLARVAYDVAEYGKTKIFVGAGFGIANVRHKLTGNRTALITTTPAAPPVAAVQANQNVQYGFKSKNKNNPAYSVMLGASIKATDNMHVELAYSFTNYGKTSRISGLGGGQIALKSHNISVGLRYDLM